MVHTIMCTYVEHGKHGITWGKCGGKCTTLLKGKWWNMVDGRMWFQLFENISTFIYVSVYSFINNKNGEKFKRSLYAHAKFPSKAS